jgi:hypothetical protein
MGGVREEILKKLFAVTLLMVVVNDVKGEKDSEGHDECLQKSRLRLRSLRGWLCQGFLPDSNPVNNYTFIQNLTATGIQIQLSYILITSPILPIF